MIFEINNKQAGMDKNISNEAKRLLKFSMSRFEGAVSRVKIHFFDVNGSRGGIDKRCRISAKLRATGHVIVLGEGGNYIEALNNCLERLVRSIRREIRKRRHSPIRLKRRTDITHADQNETIME